MLTPWWVSSSQILGCFVYGTFSVATKYALSNFTRNFFLLSYPSLLKAWAMGAYDEGPRPADLEHSFFRSFIAWAHWSFRASSWVLLIRTEWAPTTICHWNSFCLWFVHKLSANFAFHLVYHLFHTLFLLLQSSHVIVWCSWSRLHCHFWKVLTTQTHLPNRWSGTDRSRLPTTCKHRSF